MKKKPNKHLLALLGLLSGSLILTGGCNQIQNTIFTSSQTVVAASPQKIPTNTIELTQHIRTLADSTIVKIKNQNSSGSGVLINYQDGKYQILTSAHVLSSSNSNYEVITPDGKTHTATVINKGNTELGSDLGILAFNSTETYQTAPFATDLPKEEETVFVAGFSLSDSALELTPGKVTILLSQEMKGGYKIGYTNSTQQGMSGGAVFNTKGEIIGIHGKGFAILGNAYDYKNGIQPNSYLKKIMPNFSWAVPIENITQIAPGLKTPSQWAKRKQEEKSIAQVIEDVDVIAEKITVKIEPTNPALNFS